MSPQEGNKDAGISLRCGTIQEAFHLPSGENTKDQSECLAGMHISYSKLNIARILLPAAITLVLFLLGC